MKQLTQPEKIKTLLYFISKFKLYGISDDQLRKIKNDVLKLDESLFIWNESSDGYVFDVDTIFDMLTSAPFDDWRGWDNHR